MNSGKTELSERMIAAANRDGLPSDHNLRILAVKFDEATKGFYSKPQTHTAKQFMGAWARAREAWCQYSGEELI